MQLEFSYDTVYSDKTDVEEMKLHVDSVSMVSADTKDTETLYTLPATKSSPITSMVLFACCITPLVSYHMTNLLLQTYKF